MRVLIQRVEKASVTVQGEVIGKIGAGLLIFLGIEEADGAEDIQWLVRKISQLRIFPDTDGIMNHSVIDVVGELMVVSQFTLHASTKKGNRPSYIKSARPEIAVPLYRQFIEELKSASGRPVASGKFGADMKVALINDGPVTIWIDSKMRE
ncbi:MAG: D-aminoacyl-tRNA deacylase [Saprospiraceae bacterium]